MIRWEQGRAEVDQFLADGRIIRVAPNRELADNYLTQARAHLMAAPAIVGLDAPGAFSLAYDAARLGLSAVLVNQGLRARGQGAHAVLLEVVLAQLEPPRQTEFREFTWMRRLRNDTQYPEADRPVALVDDVSQAVAAVGAMVERAAILVDHMPPY
ncbi:MAG: hypothetical protein LBK95_10455 [Bifidobacteriaceae bacterium]|jgi:hypothetical protein|nr:hypothetical protein [Bifidobacteriaceae bacterium]